MHDPEIFVRNAAGAWWIGSGEWRASPQADRPPVQALKFSSQYYARLDVGRFGDSGTAYLERDSLGQWIPAR